MLAADQVALDQQRAVQLVEGLDVDFQKIAQGGRPAGGRQHGGGQLLALLGTGPGQEW